MGKWFTINKACVDVAEIYYRMLQHPLRADDVLRKTVCVWLIYYIMRAHRGQYTNNKDNKSRVRIGGGLGGGGGVREAIVWVCAVRNLTGRL